MASEIRVDKINSLSGVGTVTLSPTGVDISGITTAATLKATTGIVTTLTATTGIVTTLTTNTTRATTGIVTTLTATTGIVTTLTTNTLTANSTAKVGSGVTLSPDGDVFVTGVTTSSTVNVGAAVTINSDGVVAAGIAVTCGSINGAPIGRKNVLINGAFNVWQRGTSVTLLNSAKAMRCDRWTVIQYQAGRHSRQSLSGNIAGQGGTYCLRVGSSNGTSTRIAAGQYIESINANPLAGRECTLSFYIKFSAATFSASSGSYDNFLSFSNYYTGVDAASYSTTPASSATHIQIAQGSLPTTWTRYTKTFTPPSDMQNMTVQFQFSSLGQTTSDDDFYYELSNVQLELGSQATPFEHTSYGEDLELCKRYYQVLVEGNSQYFGVPAYQYNGSLAITQFRLEPEMRASPSLDQSTGTDYYKYYVNASEPTVSSFTGLSLPHTKGGALYVTASVTQGYAGAFSTNNASAKIAFAAEI